MAAAVFNAAIAQAQQTITEIANFAQRNIHMKFIKYTIKQGTSEWLQLRSEFITASNVAAIFGASPYKTALQYFEEFVTGTPEKFDANKQTLFDIGHNAEEKARVYVEQTFNASFPPAVVSSDHLLASLDGFNEAANVIFESKYVGFKALEELRQTNRLPDHHELQVQTQLLVSGADKCIYFAMNPNGEAAIVEVLPNADTMHTIKKVTKEFWDNLKSGKAPEPSDRDWHQPQDPRFAELAQLKIAADAAALAFDIAKQQLVEEYAKYARIRAGGITITRTVSKGNVNYSKIPELKSIDLEQYRAKDRVAYTVRLVKTQEHE